MANELTKGRELALIPDGVTGDRRSRLGMFTRWLEETGRTWQDPDLAAYRDHLLERLRPSSAVAHLGTIRSRYRDILASNQTRDLLYSMAAEGTEDPVARKAFVDELLTRIRNAIEPRNAMVRTTSMQDRPDAAQLRLTSAQAASLMAAPGIRTLKGIRDTAIIALMLSTGIREGELVGLDVGDLRQELEGELALHVREGKGGKARLVPYGDLDGCLVLVDAWLGRAGIRSGPVFRPLWRFHGVRDRRLSLRGVQLVLSSHQVVVNGELVAARPHDLRRTYARLLYESGMDLVALQQNLGHGQLATTLGYIGPLDVGKRRPLAVYEFPKLRG